jgi:hypothetical protein
MSNGRFKTSCKNCVFAKFENNKQVDCAAGVFDIFKGKREFIQEEDKSFFTLEDFACRYIRPNFWGANLSEEERLQKLQQETMIDLSAAIIVSENYKEKLQETIEQVLKQTLSFKELVFINSFNNRDDFKDILKIIEDAQIKIKWSIKQIVDKEIEDKYGIDLAFRSCNSLFIAQIICGENIPNNFVEKINEYHKQMHKFLVLKPKNNLGHCTIIQKHVYDIVQGNSTVEWNETNEIISDMIVKIERIASQENVDWAIKNLSEVCNCLQEV